MMSESKISGFVVYSLGMINFLVRHGHDIIGMEDSKKDPTGKMKVAIFRDTDELHADIEEYMILNSKRKIEKFRNNIRR